VPLPANVGLCTITGRFVDTDGDPCRGSILFTPSPGHLLDVTASPPTTLITVMPVVGILNATGDVKAADGGTLQLAATDDVDLNPSGWTWLAQCRFGNIGYSFSFAAPGGTTVDLTTVQPVAASLGNAIIQGPPGGGVTIATSAETITGSLTTKAVSPAGREAASTFIDPRKYGFATSASASVNRAALQSAIDEACGAGNPVTTTRYATRPVILPAGVYNIDATINVRSVIGLVIEGHGHCEINASSNMTSVFDINGAGYSRFQGFTITGSGGVQVDNGLYTYWDTAGALFPNTYNSYRDIVVRNLDFITGIRVGKMSSSIATDNDSFYHCIVQGPWTAGNTTRYQYGFYFGTGVGANNLVHHVYKFAANGVRYPIKVDQTQIAVYGGGVSGCEIAIYYSGSGYASFHDLDVETSERLFYSIGSGQNTNVTLENVWFRGNTINADGQLIQHNMGGSFTLRDIYCAISAYGPTVTPMTVIGPQPCRVIVRGYSVMATGNPTVDQCFYFSNTATNGDVQGFISVDAATGNASYTVDWTGPPNTQTGTTYTFIIRDANRLNTFSNAGAITATIPPNSSIPWPIGTKLQGVQLGAGTLTFQGGSGVTVNGTVTGTFASPAQYRTITATKTATNTWVASA
jgi:hypothetical protein